MYYFNTNLKHLREEKNLTREQIAKLLNVHRSTISRWEDDTMSPKLNNIYKLAEILDISITDLVGRDLLNKNYTDYDLVCNKIRELSLEKLEVLDVEINKLRKE